MFAVAVAFKKPDELTDREFQVAILLADGLNVPQIAEELGLSPSTTRTHLQNAYQKMGIRSNTSTCSRLLVHEMWKRGYFSTGERPALADRPQAKQKPKRPKKKREPKPLSHLQRAYLEARMKDDDEAAKILLKLMLREAGRSDWAQVGEDTTQDSFIGLGVKWGHQESNLDADPS